MKEQTLEPDIPSNVDPSDMDNPSMPKIHNVKQKTTYGSFLYRGWKACKAGHFYQKKSGKCRFCAVLDGPNYWSKKDDSIIVKANPPINS